MPQEIELEVIYRNHSTGRAFGVSFNSKMLGVDEVLHEQTLLDGVQKAGRRLAEYCRAQGEIEVDNNVPSL